MIGFWGLYLKGLILVVPFAIVMIIGKICKEAYVRGRSVSYYLPNNGNNDNYTKEELATAGKKAARQNRFANFINMITEWFSFDGIIFAISALLSSILCLGAVLWFLASPFEYNSNKKLIAENEAKVAYYESLEHPTVEQCQAAEKYNDSFRTAIFIEKDWADENLKKIDTEKIWATFANNVNIKAEVIKNVQ